MEFGVQFFPSVGPDLKPADNTGPKPASRPAADELGYATSARSSIISSPTAATAPTRSSSCAAAAMHAQQRAGHRRGAAGVQPSAQARGRDRHARRDLGRAARGRLRARLPAARVRPLRHRVDESRARFDEGIEQVRRLLEEENVTAQGRFHSFENVTSLPRPTQKPRPPFWVAALATPESFENAGRPAIG